MLRNKFLGILALSASLFLSVASLAQTTDAFAPSSSPAVATENYIYNGATWDRWRSAGSGPSNAALGSGRVTSEGGHSSSLNVTASTNVKATPGRVYKIIVVVTAATVSTVCDNTAACAAGTTILTIPASTTQGTVYDLNFPAATGIRLEPGAGVTLAVSYD